MSRVANKHVVISLPNARRMWPFSIFVPKVGDVKFNIPQPWMGLKKHKFDGEHYWEISKVGYSLRKVEGDLQDAGHRKLIRSLRVPENAYHQFMVFE